MLSDNHVHTDFSSDSEAPLERVLSQASRSGLRSICITDHMDYDFPDLGNGMTFVFEPEPYLTALAKARGRYPDLEIRQGVELGLKESALPQAISLVENYPFDFVIGSTHLVDNQDPYFETFWAGYEEPDGIRRYYESILENLSLDFDFDVYGHLDYILRYTPTMRKLGDETCAKEHYLEECTNRYMDVIEEILRVLISQGRGIEINTAGWKYGLGHPHPHEKILTLYRELSGEIISVGSDAHQAEHLGYSFEQVPTLLLQCGFRYYTEFCNRKPRMIPLER
ncbi:MAG: histidinol-phosphatase HisJ family protein [Lachnospiraceae bacterium]|nr:histidinol-phosphatase HisJ family protein [Lachnospiraceae bacterium]